jgi:hypothetical protein
MSNEECLNGSLSESGEGDGAFGRAEVYGWGCGGS